MIQNTIGKLVIQIFGETKRQCKILLLDQYWKKFTKLNFVLNLFSPMDANTYVFRVVISQCLCFSCSWEIVRDIFGFIHGLHGFNDVDPESDKWQDVTYTTGMSGV